MKWMSKLWLQVNPFIFVNHSEIVRTIAFNAVLPCGICSLSNHHFFNNIS
jgi:hypothetical protein